MRILRLVYEWPPPWAGLTPHPYELTVAQVKQGHNVVIFCGRWPKAGSIEIPPGVEIHPVIREPLPGTINITSSAILFVRYLLWRRKNSADIIHSHGHFAIWIYLYRYLLKSFFPWSNELKTPLVAHFHNTVVGRWGAVAEKGLYISPHSRFLAWPLAMLSDRLAVKAAAACIFVSLENRDEALKYYKADPRRCFVVESGVAKDMFKKVGQEEREKTKKELGFDPSDVVILYHGMIVERKNVHLITDALKYLPRNYKFLLVGPGDPAYIQRIDESVVKNNLSGRIIKVGYSPYPYAPIAFQAADIVVLPSTWEGLPKMITQALSCGVPALVSGFKFASQIKGVYYLNTLEPKDIAGQIIEILDSNVEVDTAKVQEMYSWEARAREVERVYDFAKKNYL